MRAAILTALCFAAAATPAAAQYRPVQIISPDASEFFIVRWDYFVGLARTDQDRYAKVATAETFGPHPIGRTISLRRQMNYAVMPVCREVMVPRRTLFNVMRNVETVRCP
jgi:hypothetical protein